LKFDVGVLRSVPVSNALSIHAPTSTPPSESKSLQTSLGVQIVEKVLGISGSTNVDGKGNPMSFLQQNDRPADPTPKPIAEFKLLQSEKIKENLEKTKLETENGSIITTVGEKVIMPKEERPSGDDQKSIPTSQKAIPTAQPTPHIKPEESSVHKKVSLSSGVSDVQKVDKSKMNSLDQKDETTKMLETILDQHAPEKAHIEKMKEINYNCEFKKGDEREECEKRESERRHEVEVEEKEKKEESLKKKYEKKDELLGKLALDMKQQYKIRDVLADRKEEHEESEAETLFIVFMLLLTLLLVLLSLCGFNLFSCVFRQCGSCLRYIKSMCNRIISKWERRDGGE